MKTHILIPAVTAALLCAAFITSKAYMRTDNTRKPDEQGHVLSSLWKAYYDARKEDKPLKMTAALEKIRKEASAKRLHWDFYDAVTQKMDVELSRNWKLRDSLQRQLSAEVEAYAEPVVTYSYRKNQGAGDLLDYVISTGSRLQACRNSQFYGRIGGQMNGLLAECVKDDYEYALWSEYGDWRGRDRAGKVLKEYLGDTYPNAAWLEYRSIEVKDPESRIAAYGEFAGKYEGQAVNLFAKARILQDSFSKLQINKAGENEYKELLAKVKAAEKERKSYSSGIDKKIANSMSDFCYLEETLEGKGVSLSIDGRDLLVLFRNLDKVELVMAPDVKEAKPLFTKSVVNGKCSFYVEDTVRVPIPKCDDGDYLFTARNGKVKASQVYAPKTLSIAIRDDSAGQRFYVADYKTGEPIGKVDLGLFRSGSYVAVAKGIAVDGFTPVPEQIMKNVKQRSVNYLEASFKDSDGFIRKSRQIDLDNHREFEKEAEERSSAFCNLFTDKSAYNPGETVKYKAVFYSGNLRKSFETFKEGETVTVKLYNTEGKELESAKLKTNGFGSVAGEFLLPKDQKNGRFRICAIKERTLQSKDIVVDEYILPTYELSFKDVDKLYFRGDTVRVEGLLSCYSGHPLSAAKVTFEVVASGRRVASGDVLPDRNGGFEISFPSGDDYWFKVSVKVTDATGETREYNRNVFVLNSFNIYIELLDEASGSLELKERSWNTSLLTKNEARLVFRVRNVDGKTVPVPVDYRISDMKGETVCTGKAESGKEVFVDLPGSGLYTVEAEARVKTSKGEEIESDEEKQILKVAPSDEVLNVPVENVFILEGSCEDGTLDKGEDIHLRFGAGDGPVWAAVELFGDRRQLLEHRMVFLEGQPGRKGSLEDIVYKYKPEYQDAVFLSVFYFRNGKYYTYTKEFRREKKELEMPLAFSVFEDKTLPGKEYSFVLRTDPGVEGVAAVFDKSTEAISPNRWNTVRLSGISAEHVYVSACNGSDGIEHGIYIRGLGRSVNSSPMYKASATRGEVMEEVAMESMDAGAVLYDALPAPAAVDEEDIDKVDLRSDFASSLAFEPFLYSDPSGNLTLKFRTSDKLSTFIVQVFAHDTKMHNALVRQEMVVSLPVKLSVAEPKYLYKGDSYVLHGTVSNSSDVPVAGAVALQVYPSADWQDSVPLGTLSQSLTVPAGGSVPFEFKVDPEDASELGLKVVFIDDDKTFSDGVFVSLPVLDARQVLTESHSGVLLAGADENALLERLKSEFTGTTAAGAEYKQTDILAMLHEALPTKADPEGRDVLSLSEAFYVRKAAGIAQAPDDDLFPRILACRNADGGFGWFEGMRSSPVITAVVLERFAKLRDSGLFSGFDASPSVVYLDHSQFIHGDSFPRWCGSLSYEQYAYVRSLFAQVPFNVVVDTKSGKDEYSENYKAFKKFIKSYLLPSAKDGRGMNGRILDKARRIKTLLNLVNNEGGNALASAWGMKFSSREKLNKSASADVASLLEYAVKHKDGGWYYPNAVLPWRGLLESELYAHSLLCDLLEGYSTEVSDGIRIWMMLQKETQKWEDDPAFVDAVNSVLRGSDEVLATKVVMLTKTYEKPFAEIVSAGNGFSIERHFFKQVTGENGGIGRLEIVEGMPVHVGDKITAEYQVSSDENRSFVKLVAPREAAFRPVEELSGHYGWWLSPLRVRGMYSVTPQGYRNVKTDRTEYYFDVYPEENTTVSEEFFVTQDGTFSSPVTTIESLYAPHYRANDGFAGPVKVTEKTEK